MVDITNGINTMTVTKGAFEGIYKLQGYTLVHDYAETITPTLVVEERPDSIDEPLPDITSDNVDEEKESPDTTIEMQEMLDKPIGQWTKEELKQFAEANDISLEGAKSVKEVREIIKAYIDSVE